MNTSKFKYKLFGRFKGRKKNNDFDDQNLDKYKVDISKDLDRKNYNILDIGSGSGENALYLSNALPNSKIITCELFYDGNLNLSKKIFESKINNILLFEGNVLQFLDELNCKDIFDEMWILFPDPWPKIRHQKRRLINRIFIEKIHFFLKDSGKLMIATDSTSYINAIIKIIYESRDLYLWKNQIFQQWDYKNLNLPETKFYKKAFKSNRKSMFFCLNKI